MSGPESGDEQSEDGELRQSPPSIRRKPSAMNFRLVTVASVLTLFQLSFSSLSEDESENVDSLDIKPPQARIQSQSSRSRRRDAHERSHHKRSERHKEDSRRSHREKHHRDKHLHSSKEREHYQREKDRYYREKQSYEAAYKDGYVEVKYSSERSYREPREESSRTIRHSEQRKYDEKKGTDIREIHYCGREEKHRRERYEDEKKADKTLQDLRERLLSKRTFKTDDEGHRQRKIEQREKKHRESEGIDSALQGAAGEYVKEIINISTGDERRYRKEERGREEDKLTEEERAEQEMRREKLLEAGK